MWKTVSNLRDLLIRRQRIAEYEVAQGLNGTFLKVKRTLIFGENPEDIPGPTRSSLEKILSNHFGVS
jgi:hypothetical protein